MSKTFTDLGQPDIEGTDDYFPTMASGSEEENRQCHEDLLNYIITRVEYDASNRNARVRRYARIDKMVSTWQKLSVEDAKRQDQMESDGKAQAISINLPLVLTHMEDMVAFLAGVYSPSSGDFFQVPTDPKMAEVGQAVVDKMNQDAKLGKQYKELCASLRSLLKYNIGGQHVRWFSPKETDGPAGQASGGRNLFDAIDMYNFFWDSSLTDPADIPKKAEWAAIARTENRMWLHQHENSEYIKGVGAIVNGENFTNRKGTAQFFRHAPGSAGISSQNSRTSDGEFNWAAYGASLDTDNRANIDGFEILEGYIRLNANEFNLKLPESGFTYSADGYYLWHFLICDSTRILRMMPVDETSEDAFVSTKIDIPYYVGYLNQDDMQEANRSTAELLAPFQQFGSFLLNVHVQGSRSNLYGLTGYDPMMFDFSDIPQGEVSARLKSKIPGRDVRSGLMRMEGGNTANEQTMQSLAQLMALMREFFPSQALPSQIAGIDRAVTQQVSAVMQGVSRRLHTMVRIADDDILGPARLQAFKNLVINEAVPTGGLTDGVVAKLLGSGIQQLNREIAETSVRQLLFAVIQNPDTASQMDIFLLMNFWAGLLPMSVDMTQFRKPEPTVAPQQGAPAQGAPAPEVPVA